MTQAELFQALKSLGMPVAYGEFPDTPENPAPLPPFITYQFAYSGDLMADNQNYLGVDNIQVELYTGHKDLVSEKKIENLLKSLYTPYRKIEARLDGEVFQVVYEIQLMGG